MGPINMVIVALQRLRPLVLSPEMWSIDVSTIALKFCSCPLIPVLLALHVIIRNHKHMLLQVFKPTIPFSAAYLAADLVFHFGPVSNCFIATFVFLVAMSQQFHAWGHMKKSNLPAAVVALQVSHCSMARKSHSLQICLLVQLKLGHTLCLVGLLALCICQVQCCCLNQLCILTAVNSMNGV